MKKYIELSKERAIRNAEIIDFKNENQKLRKELGSRIEDHESRIAKVEQASSVSKKPRTCSENANTKSTEDDSIDAFLIEHKKSVSDEIR